MKKTLLSIALLLSVSAFAQEPIGNFYTISLVPENTNQVGYQLVTSASGPDQSAAGASMVWNFNDLVAETETVTEVIIASPEEIVAYPGSTLTVKTTTTGGGTTYYYLSVDDAGGTSLTGVQTSSIVLNYNTNNGFIGTFPISYGFTNTDAVAGTFEASGVTGTFTGTAVSTFDAYGTLTVNEGSADNTAVSRLKTVQELTLIYMGIPAGTLTQTTYSYYNNDMVSTGPIFRSITNHINVPLMSINETQSTHESYDASILSTPQVAAVANLSIAPNPVNDVLHFTGT
ncbi:MAG: hypothetical protein V4581_00410, partial [Bacteroidota bacterium]